MLARCNHFGVGRHHAFPSQHKMLSSTRIHTHFTLPRRSLVSDIPSLLRRRTLSVSRSLSSSLANSINLFCSNHEVAVIGGGVMEKATEKGKVLKVGLICGGPSAERGISLNSARSLLDHLQVQILRNSVTV